MLGAMCCSSMLVFTAHAQNPQAMEASYEQVAADFAQSSSLRIAKFQADVEREFSTEQFGLKTFPTIVLLPKNSSNYIKYPSERRDVKTLSLWLKNVVSAA